jgi:hypothetical protein
MLNKYSGPATFICILFGVIMIYLGSKVDLAFATNLGIVFFGLVFTIQGAQMIASQSQAVPANIRQQMRVWGGRIYGSIFFAIGGLILLAAAANFFLPGGLQGYIDRMLNRPYGWGLVLGVIGGFSIAYGTTLLFGKADAQWKGCSAIFENLRQLFFGALLLISGLILGLVGLGLIIAPDLMATLGQLLLQLLNSLFS